jgi:hypothetical protein
VAMAGVWTQRLHAHGKGHMNANRAETRVLCMTHILSIRLGSIVHTESVCCSLQAVASNRGG